MITGETGSHQKHLTGKSLGFDPSDLVIQLLACVVRVFGGDGAHRFTELSCCFLLFLSHFYIIPTVNLLLNKNPIDKNG